ncbi:hypothetical protein [Halocalculus aciditolerans]|uniref:Uncharacterized protein n=1 Tax=Halocalculus aciditolerans TaxID=1383812 RepID=A0A830FMP4_9EURY|nr:hypothetical protein [Halocalculus aciditolerans]GGL61663.1 hypothetical protein GCM10009039_19830 [Halocalculus aciditolerans]
MSLAVASGILSAAVLNVPSVLVLFRMVDGLDDVTPRARRFTVTIGTLSLLLLIASAATSGYWILAQVTGSRLVAGALALTVLGVLPFLFVEEILYRSYFDALNT